MPTLASFVSKPSKINKYGQNVAISSPIASFSILSNMLNYIGKQGQNSDTLKRISPVSWQHIILYSRYEFNKYPDRKHE